jgi:glycosyltransferase involved in cell wall biosynthesis
MQKDNNRLLFIAPSAYPLGGVATWLDYLIPGMKDMGWDIILGLTSGKFHDVAEYIKRHYLDNIVKIENKTGSPEGRIRNIINALKAVHAEIVCGVNIPDTYAAVERVRAKNEYFPKVVMTIHGIQPDIYEDAKNYRQVLDAVICTNKLACKLAEEESGIKPDRIYYAPYGVAIPDKINPPKLSEGKLRIAYSGRFDHFQKRVCDIPDILLHLRKRGILFEFLVAGGGPAENDFIDQVKDLGLLKEVNFLGSLSYEDLVQKVYQACDILLITSFWETGPIVAWEAMSYGMAVVTSNYIGSGLEGGLKDKLNCLMFPVGDTAKAASCIEMLAEIGIRKRLVTQGYELVRKRYTHDESVHFWEEALRKIIALPPRKTFVKAERPQAAGRLDTLLGVRKAEAVRRLVGKRFIHDDPGGEWPHSYGKRREDDKDFWKYAQAMDKA